MEHNAFCVTSKHFKFSEIKAEILYGILTAENDWNNSCSFQIKAHCLIAFHFYSAK